MAELSVVSDTVALAELAALKTIDFLTEATASNEKVTWILSGGTAPMDAYRLITAMYLNKIDWSKINFILGDERCVPLYDPSSNWQAINEVLISRLPVTYDERLRPKYELSAEDAAKDYNERLSLLLEDKQDIPKLDLVWLGMGEDGHTLSLFPGQEFLDESSELVLPIHNSPKPPPDRISLSLKALKNVTQCFILAQGAGKAEVVARALKQDLSLPIARAIKTIESGGGKVNWIIDKAASTSQDL